MSKKSETESGEVARLLTILDDAKAHNFAVVTVNVSDLREALFPSEPAPLRTVAETLDAFPPAGGEQQMSEIVRGAMRDIRKLRHERDHARSICEEYRDEEEGHTSPMPGAEHLFSWEKK